jgi:energy-coupling factor transport system substrate-specific component
MDEKTGEYTIPLSRRIAILANMTALALIGNYALVSVPNVELGSVVIFTTALVFGTSMGTWCALLTSIIFSTINPWGPFIPQIWFTQLLGWVYVAAVGGLMKPRNLQVTQGRVKMFFVGGFLAAVFDLVTDIGYSSVFGVPYVVAVVLGLPFTFAHMISNAFIMALVVPSVESILKRDMASMIWDTPVPTSESIEQIGALEME